MDGVPPNDNDNRSDHSHGHRNNISDGDDDMNMGININITGFGRFNGVESNPTTHIINCLALALSNEHSQEKILPKNASLRSATVFKTAAHACRDHLISIIHDNIKQSPPSSTLYNRNVDLWIHFGVDASSHTFKLEYKAFNEAHFRVPDEDGWTPQHEPIDPFNNNTCHTLCTDLPVDMLVERLASVKGYRVLKSEDAGRFVCNWIYYNSLMLSHHTSTSNDHHHVLFVHVPPFNMIDSDTQISFACDVINEICYHLSHHYQNQNGNHNEKNSRAKECKRMRNMVLLLTVACVACVGVSIAWTCIKK